MKSVIFTDSRDLPLEDNKNHWLKSMHDMKKSKEKTKSVKLGSMSGWSETMLPRSNQDEDYAL